jgi:hypothetical protein
MCFGNCEPGGLKGILRLCQPYAGGYRLVRGLTVLLSTRPQVRTYESIDLNVFDYYQNYNEIHFNRL